MKSIQFRIDEICNEMNKYYFSPKQQEELSERLNNEGYDKYEAIEAVKHYCR
jgi:guanylate kinase